MNMKKITATLLCSLFLLTSAVTALAAQGDSALQLNLIRNFGYGGFTKIQGDFTLKITNPPPGLSEVSFFVDDQLLGVDSSAPYQAKFHTADFPPGDHRLTARGTMEGGRFLESNAITKTFLSSDEAWSETSGILIPLLVGIGVLTLLGLGLPLLMSRKRDFVLGKYGPAGGTICPRCGLPFSRSVMAPNLMVGKLSCKRILLIHPFSHTQRCSTFTLPMPLQPSEHAACSRLRQKQQNDPNLLLLPQLPRPCGLGGSA